MGNTVAPIDGSVAPAAPRLPPAQEPQLPPREQAYVDLFGELLRRASLRGGVYRLTRDDAAWWGMVGAVRRLIDRYLDATPAERPDILFQIEEAQVAREMELEDDQRPRMLDAGLVVESPDARMLRIQAETQARWDALGTAWEAFIGLAGAGGIVSRPLPPPDPVGVRPVASPVQEPERPVERPTAVEAPHQPEAHTELVDPPATIEKLRDIALDRGAFRDAIRARYAVEKDLTNRRHLVADATTRRVLQVIANTVDDPIRIINNALIARGDRPYTGNDVYEAARKLQLNIFNDPRNIVVGPAEENQQLGRDLAREIRETGHTDIMGPAVIDLYGRDAEGAKLPDQNGPRP